MEADQVYAVKLLDGTTFQVRDLPPRIVQQIAERNDVSWMVVVDAPISNVGVALDVLTEVARLSGAKFPEPLRTRDLISLLADWFILVDKDETDEEEAPDSPMVAWRAS